MLRIERVGLDHSVNLINGGMLLLTKIRQILGTRSFDAQELPQSMWLRGPAFLWSEFIEKVECLIREKPIPKGSSIISLAPFLDSDGLLRVVGWISAAQKLVGLNVHPIIIPKKCHIATLLTRHFHEKVSHQGQQISEGKIRSSEFWIIGAKHLIAFEIRHCVTCRKLQGSFCKQKMANIPKDRLTPGPPFTFVGVDTFGPWVVTTRRTRGGLATSKRWAILFTCLVSRCILSLWKNWAPPVSSMR